MAGPAPLADADASGLRFAVVVARFNEAVTSVLLDGAERTLVDAGATEDSVEVFWVPGAFEIPLVAQTCAETGRFHAVLCLGAVIRGESDHYTLVAEGAARGIADVSLSTGVPCIFEVLATPTQELAEARAGGSAGNKGVEAAHAAIQVARTIARIREP
jgi:6,7-dimethyl-8-ribityllumazine synthase